MFIFLKSEKQTIDCVQRLNCRRRNTTTRTARNVWIGLTCFPNTDGRLDLTHFLHRCHLELRIGEDGQRAVDQLLLLAELWVVELVAELMEFVDTEVLDGFLQMGNIFTAYGVPGATLGGQVPPKSSPPPSLPGRLQFLIY